MNLLAHLSLDCYEQWYKEKVSPNLSDEEKTELAKKISELSLREAIHLPGRNYPHDMFPELVPFSHTEKFTGMQLYAVFTEIMKEKGCNVRSASEMALGKENQNEQQR